MPKPWYFGDPTSRPDPDPKAKNPSPDKRFRAIDSSLRTVRVYSYADYPSPTLTRSNDRDTGIKLISGRLKKRGR